MIPHPPRAANLHRGQTPQEAFEEIKRYINDLDKWAEQIYKSLKELQWRVKENK